MALRFPFPLPYLVPNPALRHREGNSPQSWIRERVVVKLAMFQSQIFRKVLCPECFAVTVEIRDLGSQVSPEDCVTGR